MNDGDYRQQKGINLSRLDTNVKEIPFLEEAGMPLVEGVKK